MSSAKPAPPPVSVHLQLSRTAMSLVSARLALSGCTPGGLGARPEREPRLPARGGSQDFWPAISPGWLSCSPPCTARLGSSADGVCYVGQAQTSPRNAGSSAALVVPSRVASQHIQRWATTRVTKKTKENPNSKEYPILLLSFTKKTQFHAGQLRPVSVRPRQQIAKWLLTVAGRRSCCCSRYFLTRLRR